MDKDAEPIILLIDDDQLVLNSVSRMLRRYGYDVLTALDSRKAECFLRTVRVSHVLCDYDLGSEQPTGSELVMNWRERHAWIETAILYTGSDIDADSPGIDGVVFKPASPEELLSALGLPAEQGRPVSRRRRAKRASAPAQEIRAATGRNDRRRIRNG